MRDLRLKMLKRLYYLIGLRKKEKTYPNSLMKKSPNVRVTSVEKITVLDMPVICGKKEQEG